MKTLSIGRDPINQIVLEHSFVSRKHAHLIIMDNGQVLIRDLGSTNGTFVNGNRVTEAYLKPGDIVKCGDAFLNWQQYIPGKTQIKPTAPPEPVVKKPEAAPAVVSEEKTETALPVNFGKALKYIFIDIFECGDLFKTNWNKTPVILFLLFLPAAFNLSLALIPILASKSFGFLNAGQIIWFTTMITISTLAIYGISQFFTLGLFSLRWKVSFAKILLGSSIFSFLQAIPAMLFFIFVFIATSTETYYHYRSFENFLENSFSNAGAAVFSVFYITFFIIVLLTLFVFLFQYFRTIGASRTISLYFVVFSLVLNLLFQCGFFYLSMLSAEKTLHLWF